VDELPAQALAGAAPVTPAGAIAGDAMADALDAAQLLDVDVDQLAGMLVLVADDGWPGVQCGEARQAEPARGSGVCRLAASW
jgi:hypothetical protein